MSTILNGLSGRAYSFELYNRWDTWKDACGVYAFVNLGTRGIWIHYVGICQSFRTRMLSHERWDEAVAHGATHVLAHLGPNDTYAREAEERDLIAAYNPVLNTQHRTSPAPSPIAPVDLALALGLGSLSIGSLPMTPTSSTDPILGLDSLGLGGLGFLGK